MSTVQPNSLTRSEFVPIQGIVQLAGPYRVVSPRPLNSFQSSVVSIWILITLINTTVFNGFFRFYQLARYYRPMFDSRTQYHQEKTPNIAGTTAQCGKDAVKFAKV